MQKEQQLVYVYDQEQLLEIFLNHVILVFSNLVVHQVYVLDMFEQIHTYIFDQ